MKKIAIFAGISLLVMSLVACGGKPKEQGNPQTTPPAEAQTTSPDGNANPNPSPTVDPQGGNTPAPIPSKEPDYSMSTMMPDGSERVEGTYLGKADETTLLVKSVGGERKIKASATVLDHMGKLNIKEQDVVILVIRNGVAESVEKVVS